MVVTGMFTPKFKQVYQSVLAAQDCAISAIHPGRTAREVDTMARRVLEEAGFGECFNHGLGHGIGLEIHEMPFLSREPDLKLEAGMVLTVEPGVYLPGWGGVRIEDDVLVTEDGAEVLTHLPKELDAVGLDG
jgi:Xaa-Pro aminopeptidase